MHMYIQLSTYIHTYIHTYMHNNTYIKQCMHVYTDACVHAASDPISTYACTRMHVDTHKSGKQGRQITRARRMYRALALNRITAIIAVASTNLEPIFNSCALPGLNALVLLVHLASLHSRGGSWKTAVPWVERKRFGGLKSLFEANTFSYRIRP